MLAQDGKALLGRADCHKDTRGRECQDANQESFWHRTRELLVCGVEVFSTSVLFLFGHLINFANIRKIIHIKA